MAKRAKPKEPAFDTMLAALRSVLISGALLKEGDLAGIVGDAIAAAEAEQLVASVHKKDQDDFFGRNP